MVSYLVQWGHWPKGKGGKIMAKEIDAVGTEEQLIKIVQENGCEEFVKQATVACWSAVEAAVKVERKVKYR